MFLLDTRQYRDEQPCGDVTIQPCDPADRENPARTLLGPAQKAWLKDGLQRSRAAWKVVANQVMIMSLDVPARSPVNPDQWDGYAAERRELLEHVSARGIKDVTFLTGDIHTFFAGNVTPSGREGAPPVDGVPVATEFVGGSVTSEGIGDDFGLKRGRPGGGAVDRGGRAGQQPAHQGRRSDPPRLRRPGGLAGGAEGALPRGAVGRRAAQRGVHHQGVPRRPRQRPNVETVGRASSGAPSRSRSRRSRRTRSAKTMSLPRPQRTRSRFQSTTLMRSLPGPPTTRSLPLPPQMRSLPGPPSSRSRPRSPVMRSLPLPPRIVSLPVRPASVSRPGPPLRRSWPGWPSRMSLPALAEQPVVAAAAEQLVVAAPAPDVVVVLQAHDLVGVLGAADAVGRARAEEERQAVGAGVERRLVGAHDRLAAGDRALGRVGGVDDRGVVARAAVDPQVGELVDLAGVDDVLGEDVRDVVAGVDDVVAAAARAARPARRRPRACRCRCRLGARRARRRR